MQQIFDFFSGAGREVALLIVSMTPLIELRGSIPLGAALGMARRISDFGCRQPAAGTVYRAVWPAAVQVA